MISSNPLAMKPGRWHRRATRLLASGARKGLARAPRILLLAPVAILSWTGPLARAAEPSGEQIYREQCAACHGARGEGVADGYPDPFTPGRSLAELTKLIAETMPSGGPEKCTGPDAERVAAYIQNTLLPNAAPAGSPRVELARLTVGQYRHAVAELLASLRGTRRWDDRRGLLGSYNTIDDKGDGKHVFERLDPEVQFDFGSSSPRPEQMNPKLFAISWSGSVLAPQTGEYEFIVRCENSFRLYVNDRAQPLVDGWIRSGDAKEFRGTISLLGGRAYPLTLHFTKAGQGVKKMDMPDAPIPPASIRLSWKLPGRQEETLSHEYLSPVETPETLVVATNFPPDDRSTGFERGTTVTAEWERATTSAAIEVAEYVRGRLKDFAAVPELDSQHEPQVREFCARFVERALRRPLTPEQRALYVSAPFATAADLETGVERVVLLTLKSPRFLYRDLGDADGYRTASRLSFVLWNAPPDAELLAAAAEGKLRTAEEIAAQAQRMQSDPRCDARLREFLIHWLRLDQPRSLTKDSAAFPAFDAAVEADLRTSLELFLRDVIQGQPADFRQLLTSDALYLNGRLAKIYGVDLQADAPFRKVSMDPGQWAGVLSHPYLMASFADSTASSPIRRGVFVARSVLGRTLLPPPDAVVPLPPALHPDLTTRERVALQTDAAACRSCHNLINPLGFALERYDAIGRLRSEDNRRPIDASGSYQSRAGDVARFSGARELATYLAASPETHAALVEKMFYFTVQQPIRAFGPHALDQLGRELAEQNFDMRKLFSRIATLAAPAMTDPPVVSLSPSLPETREP